MKYSITVKFIAFLLCVCSLVAVAFSATGIAFMEGYNLYHTPLETKQQEQMESIGCVIAGHHAQICAATDLSNMPQDLLMELFHSSYINRLYGQYVVNIYEDGQLIYSDGIADLETVWDYTETITPHYPVIMSQYYVSRHGEAAFPEDATAESTGASYAYDAEASTQPADDEVLARVAGKEALYSEVYFGDYEYLEELGGDYKTVYSLCYYEGPTYEVRVGLAVNTLLGAEFMLVSSLYPHREYFIPTLLAGLVIFAISFVFLCTVAGRTKNGEIHLAAINRIPLDIYGVSLAGIIALMFLPVVWLFESAYYESTTGIWDNPQLCLLICCLCGFGIALCAIGFLYAFAAQVKASNNYWLRHTFIGWIFGMIGRGMKWLGRGFRIFYRGCRAVVLMLPTIWQWLLTAVLMVACTAIFFLFAAIAWHDFWIFLWGFLFIGCLVADVAMVCYGGWCFGTLLKGARTMSQGKLDHKIDTKYLYGTFKEFAEELNSLADAARIAAERQMKSERMKTELITNVSHDIKTPLTSIINYVDLMKKPHSTLEEKTYLEVLERQSLRLKKLIDDLMEMSKASTGNLTVEIGQVDAVEAVNQALGEFADKLDHVGLVPVFRHPQEQVLMAADGKLVWRVLSNLLSNAVKYALPNTRLYIDLMVLQGNAVIAIKNISREQLNVNADELMERFVRGDASRNTEGSGLGLNIAKSLVELQHGQMHLMVDGDLFKVTLIFPGC